MQCIGMPVVPRVSCCRRKDDATLARAVNDNDLLLCWSAHGVPDVGDDSPCLSLNQPRWSNGRNGIPIPAEYFA